MNDRYLYRAKRTDNGELVEGFYAVIGEKTVIIEKEREEFYDVEGEKKSHGNKIVEVDPSTICQCTGLRDKNGKLIWENDIVRIVYNGIEHIYKVIWDVSELDFKATNGKENYKSNFQYLPCCEEIDVIGSVNR